MAVAFNDNRLSFTNRAEKAGNRQLANLKRTIDAQAKAAANPRPVPLGVSPIYQGYLEKKSPKFPYIFQERYFVLWSDRLDYYEEKDDYTYRQEPHDTFYISKILGMITKDKDDPIVRFNVPDRRNGNKAREVILRAATEAEANAWFKAIENAKQAYLNALRRKINEPKNSNVVWLDGAGRKSRKTRRTRKNKTRKTRSNRR